MAWDVHFINGHSRRVQLAICFYQPNPCSQYGEPWGTRGWWILEPGQSKYVADTNNRYFYYYAESLLDGRVLDRRPERLRDNTCVQLVPEHRVH